MTSCVFSLFFLVSLISSNTVADPTGLKLRITDRGLDVLKGLGIMFLEELKNKPLRDFSKEIFGIKCDITGAKITNLRVDPAQVDLRFQEDYILFTIRILDFTVELKKTALWHSSTVTPTGHDMSITFKLRLNRNQHGHLNAKDSNCEVSDDKVQISDDSFLVSLLLCIPGSKRLLITYLVCPAAVSYVNGMLESMAMMRAMPEINQMLGNAIPEISIDYSLSGDIAVAPHSLDVPFKGRVFSQEVANDDPIEGTADPVFRETKLMAYIGVSEFFFNSAARFFNRSQPFRLDIPQLSQLGGDGNEVDAVPWWKKIPGINAVTHWITKLPEGPALLEFTETPTISITGKTGLSANVNARVESQVQPDISVLVACRLDMKVEFKENRLVLVSRKAKCDVGKPVKFHKKLDKWLRNKAVNKIIKVLVKSWFEKGVPIPLPDGVGFTESELTYHDGFLVVGGDLNFDRAAAKKALQGLGILAAE